MSNKIKKRVSNYTQVANSFLRDERISFKAKGLFCYMFSMADDWNFTIRSIAKQQKDGEASIISAMNELKEFGFIKYTKHQDGSGTYFLDDEPNVENPNVENPNLGKSTPIKKEQLIKNKNSKPPLLKQQESKGIEQENIKENKPTRKKSYFNLSKQKSFDELSDEYIEKLKEKIEKHNEDLLIRRLNVNSPLNDLYSFEEFETRFLSNGLKKKDWWMTFLQYEKYIFENERKRKGI